VDLLSLLRDKFQKLAVKASRIYNLTGSSAALLLAIEEKPFIAVERDEENARILSADINFFRALLSRENVLFLPDANGPASAGARAEIIYNLDKKNSLVMSSKNLQCTLWERDSLEGTSIRISKGSNQSRDDIEQLLKRCSYKKVPIVVERGQYSRREWIVDIYPSTSEEPLRVEFFGDEIEQIKIFNVETQQSIKSITEFLIFPSSEPGDVRSLYSVLPQRRFYCLYPFERRDDFPGDSVFLSRYSFEAGSSVDDIADRSMPTDHSDAGIYSIRGHGILPEERKSLEEFPARIKKISRRNKVIIIASSKGQSERLKDIFREHDMIVPAINTDNLVVFEGNISISVGSLSRGLFIDGLLIITEREIFGQRPSHRPIIKSKVSNLLLSLDDLNPGDFVVHRDHGIGRFTEVVRQKMDGSELDLLLIEYDEGRLYIPIYNIKSVSKYHAQEGTIPKIDRLGGKTWHRKKAKAKRKVREIASRLLSLYADRRIRKGFSFSGDTELHREFDSFFSYEETSDQVKTIEEIKRDMESDRPMDRLLCGDVGYGKTEVAMRAAFKAVYDNRQVAVLVPTTILAEQHYRTFKERFSGFPISIDFLSRFKSKKQTETTLKEIRDGQIDIIIGTHSLLSKKVVFARLGLLIVDEEHRFGIGQKEKIKEVRKNVDVLNLTATPIPRTLHMALSGIRDMSFIETPPEERLSVKTVVSLFDEKLIKESIAREIYREGQVFFVHNRIKDIYKIANIVKELVPHVRVEVAHGQMPERELERVMHRFFEGEANVLVSTAIVGSGLDIPRANTIVVSRADKIGLADLYQLRGRVGRSNVKAYAFFLVPDEAHMTEDAKKRLQAVQEMSYLGAGFRLALKDLEIRGAGDVFGPEQSGHINEIGFDLYVEMLEKTVAELKGYAIKEEIDPLIELRSSSFIPEEYVEDIPLRLSIYRRMASMRKEEDITAFEEELNDRFGKPPEELANLLDIVRLKILARELSVSRIQDLKGAIRFIFSDDTKVEPNHIIELQRSGSEKIKYLPEGFEIDIKKLHLKEIQKKVYEILKGLQGKLEVSEMDVS
jgi:transcription-repair coupling factor (superfamily II helicase)